MNDFKENEYTIGYRVQELRKDKGWNQKELADKLFVNRSQISRLENNETTNVNTAMLISIAKLFHVSTDYLLGLTPIKVPKSYDISQLGLSEKAVRRIILKEIAHIPTAPEDPLSSYRCVLFPPPYRGDSWSYNIARLQICNPQDAILRGSQALPRLFDSIFRDFPRLSEFP